MLVTIFQAATDWAVTALMCGLSCTKITNSASAVCLYLLENQFQSHTLPFSEKKINASPKVPKLPTLIFLYAIEKKKEVLCYLLILA